MRTKGLKLLAVGVLLSLPWSIGSAQNQALSAPANYVVTNLGGLGGTQSVAYGVNDLGLIAGTSALSGDANEHGFLWILGLKVDLGTFGGPNSEAVFAPNIVGQITGAAETSTPDPLGEDFCASGTNLTCVPFIWQLGLKIQLRTLGGHNGEGVDINDLGQVVGGTETAVHDADLPGAPGAADPSRRVDLRTSESVAHVRR